MSTPWSSPGIFNVIDEWWDDGGTYRGMVPNDASQAANNTAVLQAIINLAQTLHCETSPPYAAIILFPGHYSVPGPDSDGTDPGTDAGAVYYLTCAPDETYAVQVTCDNPIRFLGTGNVTLAMTDEGGAFGDIFQFNVTSSNPGGFTFEDLTFSYPYIDESTIGIPDYCAIRGTETGGLSYCRILRCVFSDCPTGVWLINSLQCSIFQCSFLYANNAGVADLRWFIAQSITVRMG
jgi:hypothetical protein